MKPEIKVFHCAPVVLGGSGVSPETNVVEFNVTTKPTVWEWRNFEE